MQTDVPVLVITGPVGAGKTTVAAMVSELLEQERIAYAFIDLDALRWHYPTPPDDRFSVRLAMKNLASLWSNFQESGSTRLIVADVVEMREDLERYQDAIPGADIFVVRLRASLQTLIQRVRQREIGPGLEWHLKRANVLSAIMEHAKVEDLLIETDDKSVVEIAEEIVAAWL